MKNLFSLDAERRGSMKTFDESWLLSREMLEIEVRKREDTLLDLTAACSDFSGREIKEFVRETFLLNRKLRTWDEEKTIVEKVDKSLKTKSVIRILKRCGMDVYSYVDAVKLIGEGSLQLPFFTHLVQNSKEVENRYESIELHG